MKSLKLLILLFLFTVHTSAQSDEIRIPMTAEGWESATGQVEFADHEGAPAMKILSPEDLLTVKDITFEDGTIEFDVEFADTAGFVTAIFRMESEEDAEAFYIRSYRIGDPTGYDAVQYTASVKGAFLWDLHPHYQSPAVLKGGEWNHIKLVVSGKQMAVYVNDMTRPTLEVPKLEANTTEGRLAFSGTAIFANLVIRPSEVEGLRSTEGFDPTRNDPRYVRQWKVTEPVPLPPGQELVSANQFNLFSEHLPTPETVWAAIAAERLGLVNLSRRFGASQERRVVWLKTTLATETEQMRRLDLGFSDEVWVVLNGQLVYVDKNLYSHPIQKEPDGRLSIENTSFDLPLRSGTNEVLIGVANDFFGWGIAARLDSIEGITVAE